MYSHILENGYMEIGPIVLQVLRDALSLGARAERLTTESPLLGALPEMDSMAVVNVIAALEDRFGISVDDDEISGETFATVGSLTKFIQTKARL
jgi:acyl carrier protein